MPRFELIAGLDIGTTKVCLAVARRQLGQPDVEFLGCFATECDGVSGSSIADLSILTDAISKVLEQAQDSTKLKINTAFVNIAGSHIQQDFVRGKVNILHKETEVSKMDLAAACRNAKVSAVTYDRQPILIVPQDYILDGQGAIKNPIGLFGSKLEVDYLFVSGSTAAIASLSKAINMAGFEIEEIVPSNLASSFSALTKPEKDLGVVLVDIGGDVSEVSIFSEGTIRYDKMLATGAEELTKAIAAELKVGRAIAAKIIKNYCKLDLWCGISKTEIPTTARRASFRAENRVKLSPKAIFLSGPGNCDERLLIKEASGNRTVTRGKLQKIIEPSVKAILEAIREAIQASNYATMASSGAVLIGRLSAMDGLAELAEVIFNMPVKVGSVAGYDMSCVTAIGLVRYGCRARNSKLFGPDGVSENIFKRAFQAARDFMYDYF